MNRLPLLRAAMALLLPPALMAAAPAPIVPAVASGNWRVEQGNGKCVAVRWFAAGKERFAVGLQPVTATPGWLLTLRLARTVPTNARMFALVDGSALSPLPFDYMGEAANKDRIFQRGLDRDQAERLLAGSGLSVLQKTRMIGVPLTRLPDLQQLLRACEADFLVGLGIPREVQARVATAPRLLDGTALARTEDYPRRLAAEGIGGTVRMVVAVAADGRPAACQVIGGSGTGELDALSCRLVQERARFAPAADGEGRPVIGPAPLTLVWRAGGWTIQFLPPGTAEPYGWR